MTKYMNIYYHKLELNEFKKRSYCDFSGRLHSINIFFKSHHPAGLKFFCTLPLICSSSQSWLKRSTDSHNASIVETLYRQMCLSKSCPITWIYHSWTPIKLWETLKCDQWKNEPLSHDRFQPHIAWRHTTTFVAFPLQQVRGGIDKLWKHRLHSAHSQLVVFWPNISRVESLNHLFWGNLIHELPLQIRDHQMHRNFQTDEKSISRFKQETAAHQQNNYSIYSTYILILRFTTTFYHNYNCTYQWMTNDGKACGN